MRMNDRALVEVDGLLAAFIYLDHTEASLQGNLTCTNSICHHATATPVYNTENAQSLPIDGAIRAPDLAWASARAVRDEMQMLWDTVYEDAKGLIYAGVFAYRNTLTSLRPNDLARIFALCSLSYVAHRLLHARGRLLQDGFLTGIHVWRDSIEDEDERRAFNQLTSHLWSKGQNRRSSKNLKSEEPSHYFTRTLQHDESTSFSSVKHCVSPFVQQSSAKYTQQAQQHPDPQGTPWNFDLPCESDSLSLFLANGESTNDVNAWAHGLESFTDMAIDTQRMFNAEPYTESGIWSDLSSISSLDLYMPDMLGFRTPGSPVALPLNHSRLDTNPLHEPGDRSLVGITTSANSLQTTSVHLAIREFIHDNGQFWFQLAGRGLVSKDIASCRSWCQERWGQKKHIRTSYVQKLLSARRTQDKTSSGIISIVDTFVDWGFLQSIENIEFYMEVLADLLFDDKTSCREFIDWIRASSKEKLHQCPDSFQELAQRP
ncbi:hypothetical protein FMUND_10041 [Fusarium mundagurra]|uniref:Uncharacterized protein n=1 Tax=Fusarium mundagurra TaxID=1567541 RepID=A0A8H5YDS3_9HYPO|nr:hypothetical protein FMUND_10041 [Fusarium mundagurra]